MENSDERDYAEEAYNRRSVEDRWQQCPGCPGGALYDTWDGTDGCHRHSTATYNAKNRDATSAGGQL